MLESCIMLELKVLLRFFEGDFILKLLFLMLLYSILPLAEIFILLKLGGILGNYLTLALAASTGLFGVLIALKEFRNTLKRIRTAIKEGVYPGKELIGLVIILAGGIFLLTPGFITDFLGFMLFLPVVRTLVGKIVSRRLEKRLKEVYEYLKLYEL